MSTTGIWGARDPKEGTAFRGEEINKRIINATGKFIDRWNELVGIY